jgi:DNA-binding transcriptional regulator YiaG
MPASQPWLKTSEAARRLHVSAKTVSRWASEGPWSTAAPSAATAATTPS